jgi:hypothetical protein
MSAHSQSLTEAEEDTRKSSLIMKAIRAEMEIEASLTKD